MQIQLKQTEIITALKGYIAAQGINLSGKKVEIFFTASRSAAGIVADIEINDVAQTEAIPAVASIAVDPAPAAQAEAAAPVAEDPPFEVNKPVAPAASLFN